MQRQCDLFFIKLTCFHRKFSFDFILTHYENFLILCVPIFRVKTRVKRLSKKQHPEDMQDVKTLHKELKQLCKELSRIKEAPAILKKATAYVVKESVICPWKTV